MNEYSLLLDGFVEEELWEAKGYFPSAVLRFAEKEYRLNFYDLERLRQEVVGELKSDKVFFESNLVVVSKVNRANLERAVEQLIASGQYKVLLEN